MSKKIIMSISIGCVAFILTMLMFTQFKTVDKTDIAAIEIMRESELRTEISNWKANYEEVDEKLNDIQKKIQEYKEKLSSDENATNLLASEVEEAETFLGYTDVQGTGIIVTLSNNDICEISYTDLLRLVNELNILGAEAISINDERIISMSDIALVNNRLILVNGKKISGPYVVKAIGDSKTFENTLGIKEGFINELEAEEKSISYTLEDNIVVPAYEDKEKIEFKYAKENKEEQEVQK